MQLLATIINEFQNTEKEISVERKQEMFELFQGTCTDMAYNCIMLLYEQSCEEYVNQSGMVVQKIGAIRLRAIELLKVILITVLKVEAVQKAFSPILRLKVIRTCLHMLKTYPFSCSSHRQCIQILKTIKPHLNQDDLGLLKQFILKEFTPNQKMNFPSGNTTSGPNMGQITQIAFELRDIFNQQIDEQDSADEDAMDSQTQ